jgi:hypothetical protein
MGRERITYRNLPADALEGALLEGGIIEFGSCGYTNDPHALVQNPDYLKDWKQHVIAMAQLSRRALFASTEKAKIDVVTGARPQTPDGQDAPWFGYDPVSGSPIMAPP